MHDEKFPVEDIKSKISNIFFMKPEKGTRLYDIRHSLAHMLAEAVLDMFPEAQLGTGPVTDNGFYYDFLLPRPLIPEDLPLLQKRMKKYVKQT